MAKILDRAGLGAAITAAQNDSNLSTLAGKNQSITATSHTIDVDDQGEVLEYSNASPIAVTLPTIVSVSGSNIYTDDFSVTLKNIGAGLVTVTRGGTDTFEGGGTSITIQRGETVTIMTDSSLAIWNILSDKNQIHYYGGASAAGTDTYAATLPRPPAAYETGRIYTFKADVGNTGACTINFNSIGAASIKLQDGQDPYNNAIIANHLVELMYDGTNMVLLNPYTGGTMLKVSLSGTQSYDSSVDTTVFFDTESSTMPDTFSEFNTGTYTFTAAKAGWYHNKVSLYCTGLSIAVSFEIIVYKNGSTPVISYTSFDLTTVGTREVSGIIYLAAGDTLTIEGPSSGANTMSISGGENATFWEIYRIR